MSRLPSDEYGTFREDALISINEWLIWSFLNEDNSSEYLPVFHYCSIEAMKSILQNKKLWFTDINI